MLCVIAGPQRQGLDRVSLRAARPACRLPSQGLLVFTGLWGASLEFLAADNTFLVWQLAGSQLRRWRGGGGVAAAAVLQVNIPSWHLPEFLGFFDNGHTLYLQISYAVAVV
jgi:hypothetical protein